MKTVIACDSFKGTLSAAEASHAVALGIRDTFPEAYITELPVADGGEGTVEAFVSAGATEVEIDGVSDALGRPRVASYCILADGLTAVVECAQAVGLCLIAPENRNILAADSRGLAALLSDAARRGCKRILVGLGGSATNDGGVGMLAALGYKFFDAAGNRITEYGGAVLSRIASVDSSCRAPWLDNITVDVLCDVTAPFCGPQGATRVFARQKGADDAAIDRLEDGMKSFAAVVRRSTGLDVASMPGAGAAGGLGGAFAAFLGARLLPGIDTILDAIGFDAALAGADLVITGEGSIDRQSLMGKATCGILHRGLAASVPVVAIAGCVKERDTLLRAGFSDVLQVIVPPGEDTHSLRPHNAFHNLRTTAQTFAKSL